MPNDDTDRRHDDEARARHERAVAAGEERLLTRTLDRGRLHSYAPDEIGFAPPDRGRSSPRRSGWSSWRPFSQP